MSIPAYQLQSLAGDNYAKKRVKVKLHKQYETEEQRTQASGKIDDNVKTIFDSILRNLQMQLTTISVAEATVSMNDEDFEPEEETMQYTTQGIIGGFAKLVGLAFELKFLFTKLGELKKGVLPSLDYPRIRTMLDKVDEAYGNYGDNGFLLALSEVVEMRERAGLAVPQTDRLLDMYEQKMDDCREMLLALEGNVYSQKLKGVFLESDVNKENFIPVEDYKFFLKLKDEGYLDEDFEIASAHSRASFFRRLGQEDPDLSTIGSYESGSESDETEETEESDSDDESGSSYYAPTGSVFSSAQGSRQSGHHSHSSRGSNVSGMGLSGGVVYTIPQHQKLHGAYPLRYY